MFRGGMSTTRPYLFLILGTMLGFFMGLTYGRMMLAFLVYGHLGGPCIWPSDAVTFGGIDLSTLEWSERLQCYLHPERKPWAHFGI